MLKFLGFGSCFNVEKGNTSAYYLNKEKKSLLLIDCGESVFERLVNENILEDVDDITIVITHLHSDHIGSLPSLIFYLNLVLKKKPIIVFPNKELISSTILFCFGTNSDYYELYTPSEYTKYNITAIKQRHSVIDEDYGYEFKIMGKKIYYSGDTNTLSKIVLDKFLNDEYDYFYHETTRFKNNAHYHIERLKKNIPLEKRNKVTCMHLDDDETIKLAIESGFNVPNI